MIVLSVDSPAAVDWHLNPINLTPPNPKVATTSLRIYGWVDGQRAVLMKFRSPVGMVTCHQVERDDITASAWAFESEPFGPFYRAD